MRPLRQTLLTAAALLVAASAAPAQTASPAPDSAFVKTEARIAMRDGVHLYTPIYAPRTARGPLPIILMRTPYGIDGAAGNFRSYLKELAEDGYIFAFQDIRGRYRSEGKFVMMRPPRDRSDPKAIDEGTDTYDTIAWLLKNVPDNN